MTYVLAGGQGYSGPLIGVHLLSFMVVAIFV